MKKLGIAVALIVIAVLIVLWQTFVIIGAGERGVVLTWGAVSDKILDEGIHFMVPVAQRVEILDVKTKKDEVEVLSYSKDIQSVSAVIALNYHIVPEMVNKLWQEIGATYEHKIIDPAVQESVKAATAQFTAQELIEKRHEVKEDIKMKLKERLEEIYIVIDDLSIVNFDFSDAYELAVEEKQVAQQKSLKAKNDLERIKIEAEQAIAQAKAQAESIKIQAEALKFNTDLIQLKAVEKWNGVLPAYMMGNSVPFLNLSVK